MTLYRTIVADPPWPQKNAPTSPIGHSLGPNRPIIGQAFPYPALGIEDIAALPIGDWADPTGCNVFLWTTTSMIRHGFAILDAWRCPYRQTLVWRKTNASPFSGTGSVARMDVEFVLVGRRSGASFSGRMDSSVFTSASSARRGWDGSRKPEAFLDLVESLSPGPYLELFARRQRLGWDTWGNEAFKHVGFSEGIEPDYAGAFDGVSVTSDADSGL